MVVQVSMKQEMELAMKLLEKDIHEKQVSIHFHAAFLFPSYLQKLSRAESRQNVHKMKNLNINKRHSTDSII